jgi:hypothetical protein
MNDKSLTAKTAARNSLNLNGNRLEDLQYLQSVGAPMTAQTTKFHKGKLAALTDRGDEIKP